MTDEISIENPEKGDIQKAVRLINDYNKNYTHFESFTAESFMAYINRIPAYGKDNFWVAKNGEEVVACAGLWDSSQLADQYYDKMPAVMKAMLYVFGFMGLFTKMPKVPVEGERFKFQMMANYAFNPKNPDAMHDLLKYLGNSLVDANCNYLASVFDSRDLLSDIVKSFHPQMDIWRVYARSLNEEMAEFGPLYVDAKDLIP